MTEKTSNYMNVESLLNEAENTKFTLHAKGTSNKHRIVIRYYDGHGEFEEVIKTTSEPTAKPYSNAEQHSKRQAEIEQRRKTGKTSIERLADQMFGSNE